MSRVSGSPQVISSAGRPALRRLIVRSTARLTPNLQRIVFEGADLSGYEFHRQSFGPFIKLLLPPNHGSGTPVWPSMVDGRLLWPDDVNRLVTRTYTVRNFDPIDQLLTIDFVLHDPDGPASTFARNARPGERVAMLDRGHSTPLDFDHYVLVADHSALPAIAQIIENRLTGAFIHAVVALRDARDMLRFPVSPALQVQWIVEPGNDARIARQVAHVRHCLDRLTGSIYLWAGGEAAEVAAMRSLAAGYRLENTHLLKYWQAMT